jgi:hypothetical protein
MNANPNIDQDSATEIPGTNFPNKTDITTHKVRFTFLQDKSGSILTAKEVTLPELQEMVLAAKEATKSDLPWLKGSVRRQSLAQGQPQARQKRYRV